MQFDLRRGSGGGAGSEFGGGKGLFVVSIWGFLRV